jgi:RNA polymerase sigma factor (sigma-70 family)
MQPDSPADDSAPGHAGEESRARLIDRLFREHNNSLIQFLAARLGSHQEAMEIAQESYVRLLKLDTPGAVSYLRAFLFKTASNLAIDRMRTRSYRERNTSLEFFEKLPLAATPEREVGGMQEIGLLLKCIGTLPARARYAFIQNKFHGMDVDVIAKDMNITPRMVRAHLVRAMVQCRQALDAAAGQTDSTRDGAP